MSKLLCKKAMTHAEIARACGLADATVTNYLHTYEGFSKQEDGRYKFERRRNQGGRPPVERRRP